MDIGKIVRAMYETYAGLHPKMLAGFPFKLEWRMTPQTLAELAKEHRVPKGALTLGTSIVQLTAFLGIPVELTNYVSDGDVELVIKVM